MTKLTKTMTAQLTALTAAQFVFMTEKDGKAIVEAGFATVDGENTDGDKAAVSITDAGREAIGETVQTNDQAAAEASSSVEIDDAVPIPVTTRKRRASAYPFDQLEVGQSFHVPKTEDCPNPHARLASSITGARKMFSKPTGKKETVTRKVYKRIEGSKAFEKDENGKRIVEGTEQVERDVMELTRNFKGAEVGADDPKGPGARVWRTA